MASKDGNAGEVRADLARLAEVLLEYYGVTQPPVPVERMLKQPPAGIGVDTAQISLVMEHGLYSHAPRLAMARPLCREISRSKGVASTLGADVRQPVSYSDVQFFARCLLMPPHWVQNMVSQGLSVEQISLQLQVPSYAVVTRLAELGLPVPGAQG